MDINDLFPDTEALRQYVNVVSATEFTTFKPFLKEAFRTYILKYFGSMTQQINNDLIAVDLVKAAVAPLAMAMAVDELCVSIGNAGITVQSSKDGSRVPASDAKIRMAKLAMAKRGIDVLGELCRHIKENPGSYPKPEKEDWAAGINGILPTYTEFHGMIAMPGAFMAFMTVAPTIAQLQKLELKQTLGNELYLNLINYNQLQEKKEAFEKLREAAVTFLCNKAAWLFSSAKTKEERNFNGNLEFPAAVYPIFYDKVDDGNYYAEFAEKAMTEIKSVMKEEAEELGIGKAEGMDFNGPKRKIFYALG